MHANVACFWRNTDDSSSPCTSRSAPGGTRTTSDQDHALDLWSACDSFRDDVSHYRRNHVRVFANDDGLM